MNIKDKIKIQNEIQEAYEHLEANMDRRDIPCSVYHSIRNRIIEKYKKEYPELSEEDFAHI